MAVVDFTTCTNGRYRPFGCHRGQQTPFGRRAPGEQNIADSTGVSVDTVRAAFGLLREDGYIETAAGIGNFIVEKPAR